MPTKPGAEIILARRVGSPSDWPNANPFQKGDIVAEVDIRTPEISVGDAQTLRGIAGQILGANNARDVQVLALGSRIEGVYRVVGTAKTDARPNCVALPDFLNEGHRIPADLPLLPFIVRSLTESSAS